MPGRASYDVLKSQFVTSNISENIVRGNFQFRECKKFFCSDSELNSSFGFNPISYRGNHLNIIVFNLISLAIRCSCRKFCDN